MTGSRCSEVPPIKLVLIWEVWGSGWPLLTGGRCSEVAVNTGLTVHCFANQEQYFLISFDCHKKDLHVSHVILLDLKTLNSSLEEHTILTSKIKKQNFLENNYLLL